MAIGTTFTLPNYTGPLFEVAKKNAKFLGAIGGLNNNAFRVVNDVEFGITTYNLGADDSNAANQEGQNAPAGSPIARSGVSNVLEIFHKSIELSYTKLGATARLADDAPDGANSVAAEEDFQVEQTLKKVARIVNHAFINGVYAFPADNTAPRRTRGLLSAITTNVVAADGGSGAADDLDASYVEALVKMIFDNGGLEDENGAVILCNSAQKIRLDRIYGKAPDTVNVGGVMLEKLYTPLGAFSIMVERSMPQDSLAIVSLDVIKPAGLLVPGKGILFEEPLSLTGAAVKTQIYGELGLDYGPESFHGKITNLKTTLPA